MSDVVLVTGAGGFVGTHVCQALLTEGYQVRAAVRSTRAPPGAQEVRFREFSDPAFRRAAEGCRAVVHLAGRAHVTGPAGDASRAFHRSNTVATRIIGEIAAGARVKTFVFMSSIAAVSNSASERVSDDEVVEPDTPYGISKRAAEVAIEDIGRASGMRVITLRPPMVFGERMLGNPLQLLKYVARGIPVPVVTPPVMKSVMYGGNLGEAVTAALASPALAGRFCVTDSTPLSVRELVAAYALSLDQTPKTINVPRSLLRAAGTVGDLIGRVMPFPVNTRAVVRLTQSLVVNGSGFAAASGYGVKYSREEGIRRTAEWYRGRR